MDKRAFLVKKKDVALEATELRGKGEYHSERGAILPFSVGDFLITAPDGDQWIVSAEYMAENYRRV